MLQLLLSLLWAGVLAQNGHWLKVQESVTVQEGLCVSVPCTIHYAVDDGADSAPTHGYWYRQETNPYRSILVATNNPNSEVQEEIKGRFHLLGDPRTYNCSLDIRDARRTDEGLYYFRIEKGKYFRYSYAKNMLSVHVTDFTHKPDILVPGTMESGHPGNLTCLVTWACAWGMPPIFSWTSAAHSSLVPKAHLSPVLSLTPQPQDHEATLTCQVTLPRTRVTTERTIHLNVSYSPQNLTITVFQGNGTAPTVLENGSTLPFLEGQSLHLVCVVDSNPPSRLSWTQGSLTLSSSQPGVLELPLLHVRDEGELTCRAQHPRGSLHSSLNLSLQKKFQPLSGVMLGALGGAGVTAMLFLSFCGIVIIVRSCRKKTTSAVSGMEGAKAITDSTSQGSLIESWQDSPIDHPTPALTVSFSGKEEEIQYASLRFHKMKPENSQEQEEATDTEYAEIGIRK